MANLSGRYFSLETTTKDDDDVMFLPKGLNVSNATRAVFNTYSHHRSEGNDDSISFIYSSSASSDRSTTDEGYREEDDGRFEDLHLNRLNIENKSESLSESFQKSFKVNEKNEDRSPLEFDKSFFIDKRASDVYDSDATITSDVEDIFDDDDNDDSGNIGDNILPAQNKNQFYESEKQNIFIESQTPTFTGNSKQCQSQFSQTLQSFSQSAPTQLLLPKSIAPNTCHNRLYRRKSYEKRYPCEYCGKIFSFPSVLKTHQKRALICKDYFAARQLMEPKPEPMNLTSSELSSESLPPPRPPVYRNGVKVYECALCPAYFKGRDNLKKHELRHTGARPYECTLCGKSFRQSSNLTRHRLVHSDHRAYECSVINCGQKFKTRDSLKMHLAMLHNILLPSTNRNSKKVVEKNVE